jgi:2,3-dihydroxybenzoate-AMP ligase
VPPVPVDGFTPIPPGRAGRYRRAGLWTGENLAEAVLAAVARRPAGQPVLTSGAAGVTAAEMLASTERLSGRLRRLGLGDGARVVVQLPNGPEFVILVLALIHAGGIPVMALPAYRSHELRHVLRTSGAVAMAVPRRLGRVDALQSARAIRAGCPQLATLLVLDPDGPLADGEHDLRALAAGGAPDGDRRAAPGGGEVALMLQSGGSTGLPKCIPRTHDDYLCNLRVSAQACGLGDGHVYLAVLPAGHNFTLGCPGVLGTLLAGGTVVFAAPQTAAVAAAVAAHHVTLTAAVPTLALAYAARAAAPWPEVLLQVGGARLLPGAAREVLGRLGGRLQQVYGMAEGLLNFTRLDDPPEVVAETQGRPASPADEIRVVDPAGRPVRAGALGELLARGPYTIAAYYRAADPAAFTPDGFYRTGDLVRRHPSGNLIVEGRAKDVINRNGETISAAEIERLILSHPDVAVAAAVAVPSAEQGEGICVFAVPRPGLTITLSALRRHLTGLDVARFKLPDRLELLDELPVTPVGKIDKSVLAQRAAR